MQNICRAVFAARSEKPRAVRRQDYAADERLLMREGGLGWNVGNIVSIYCD